MEVYHLQFVGRDLVESFGDDILFVALIAVKNVCGIRGGLYSDQIIEWRTGRMGLVPIGIAGQMQGSEIVGICHSEIPIVIGRTVVAHIAVALGYRQVFFCFDSGVFVGTAEQFHVV